MRASQKVILALALLFGLGGAAFMMYAAWQHNPQGEFHETDGSGTIHWLSWLPIGAGWFGAAFGLAWLPASAVELVICSLHRRGARRRARSPSPSRRADTDG